MRHYAINLLYNNVHNQVGNLCFDVNGNPVIVNEEEIQAKIAELEAAEPLRLLRIERDRKLTEVDWWTSRALDGTPLTTEQTVYRQALRDLPENSANVAIDENGTLINVEWPVKPE